MLAACILAFCDRNKVLCNSYNMGKRDLPDICPSPRAAGPKVRAYISGKF